MTISMLFFSVVLIFCFSFCYFEQLYITSEDMSITSSHYFVKEKLLLKNLRRLKLCNVVFVGIAKYTNNKTNEFILTPRAVFDFLM